MRPVFLVRTSGIALILCSLAVAGADAGDKTPEDIKNNRAARADARFEEDGVKLVLLWFIGALQQ